MARASDILALISPTIFSDFPLVCIPPTSIIKNHPGARNASWLPHL
jgi:hypothetical protein